jgi:hypothetical protein
MCKVQEGSPASSREVITMLDLHERTRDGDTGIHVRTIQQLCPIAATTP